MIAITGATGNLGRLVVDALLDRGVPARDLVAVVRSPEKATNLAGRGVQVRVADYTQPDTLIAAFAGVDKLLLVSSNAVGQRHVQHANVVNAARKAGVRLLVYTSIAKADTTRMQLAAEHRATEALIRDSGLPFVFLRNSWYLENYTGNLAQTLTQGAILGSAGDGRVSAATRADFAAAAAAVLTEHGHENAVYELGGDHAFTLAELAAEISAQSGTQIRYRDLPAEEFIKVLVGAGVPEAAAAVYADADLALARGDLLVESGDLRKLIGRPTSTITRAVAAALEA
jgi:NAD(P)H dehydrogenase (quinone)